MAHFIQIHINVKRNAEDTRMVPLNLNRFSLYVGGIRIVDKMPLVPLCFALQWQCIANANATVTPTVASLLAETTNLECNVIKIDN